MAAMTERRGFCTKKVHSLQMTISEAIATTTPRKRSNSGWRRHRQYHSSLRARTPASVPTRRLHSVEEGEVGSLFIRAAGVEPCSKTRELFGKKMESLKLFETLNLRHPPFNTTIMHRKRDMLITSSRPGYGRFRLPSQKIRHDQRSMLYHSPS